MIGRLVNWLRTRLSRSRSRPSNVFDLTYHCAYQVFPRMSLGMPGNFEKWRLEASRPAAMFYVFACSVSGHNPDPETAEGFIWHSGQLGNGLDYVVLEYPRPDPVTTTAEEMAAFPTLAKGSDSKLSPYYSVLIGHLSDTTENSDRQVYVLGQSPVADVTTLRRVTLAGHYNLGPGPEPTLDSLLASLLAVEGRKVQGGVILNEEMMSPADKKLTEELQSWSKAELEERMRTPDNA